MLAAVQRLFFPLPPSLLMTAITFVSFSALAYCGVSEVAGNHLQYSKFWNAASPTKVIAGWWSVRIPARIGMLIFYTPALVAATASLWGFPVDVASTGTRGFLLCLALTVHFLKRDLEVLFVHQFSGHIMLDSAISIASSYFVGAVGMVYAQHFTTGMPEPSIDLKYIGEMLFLVGVIGNFYHHYILSRLRDRNDKTYKIPKGGLFGVVICPHYLFEIIAVIGLTFISQTLYALAFTVGTIVYLTGRSYTTRKWYLSKFEDFPKEVKALVPYVF